jgi:hypothetical protein
MSYKKNDLGQHYKDYHQQTGNLYATGQLLAEGEARTTLYPLMLALRQAIRRMLKRHPETALSRSEVTQGNALSHLRHREG